MSLYAVMISDFDREHLLSKVTCAGGQDICCQHDDPHLQGLLVRNARASFRNIASLFYLG